MNFSVAVGNPIERSYDRWVEKYNGRIVGIQKDHYLGIDNVFRDRKLYEVFNPDLVVDNG